MKILILNGPNLNLLGNREPSVYGKTTMEAVISGLAEKFGEAEILYFQSNGEGEIIDRLQENDFDALVINPGAFTHYSYAIADCLRNISQKKVEVHISNIYQRELFRQKTVTAPCCDAVIGGMGVTGYEMAVRFCLS